VAITEVDLDPGEGASPDSFFPRSDRNRRIKPIGGQKVFFMNTKNSMNRLPLRRGLLLSSLALAWFALVPQARAVCQEGCDLSNGNTFLGDDALIQDTTGLDNTAIGSLALSSNTTGSYNTATGFQTLLNNTIGTFNTATGRDALNSNTAGSSNTAVGVEALNSNTAGNSNTAVGVVALLNNDGDNNIALGNSAGSNLTTGDNNIDIGNTGATGESGKIRIGTRGTHTATFIAGISGVAVTGSQVIVNSNGKLGVSASSKRFKDAVKPMGKASEAILELKPVTFRYKKELDPDDIPQFGLVAEDVEKVDADLVARDDDGKPYSVRYEAVNTMLLNEFLKEHRRVETLEATVACQQSINAEQQKEIQALTASLKEQAAQIQKVSARLEMSRPAPQTVVNNP
jgi:Chaperone of endosialidase